MIWKGLYPGHIQTTHLSLESLLWMFHCHVSFQGGKPPVFQWKRFSPPLSTTPKKKTLVRAFKRYQQETLSNGKCGYPWGSTLNLYLHVPTMYGFYRAYGVIFRVLSQWYPHFPFGSHDNLQKIFVLMAKVTFQMIWFNTPKNAGVSSSVVWLRNHIITFARVFRKPTNMQLIRCWSTPKLPHHILKIIGNQGLLSASSLFFVDENLPIFWGGCTLLCG